MRVSAEEMIKPSVYGQAIIILVYVPLLTFTGVEGKTFAPMALTVLIAVVAAFVLSLTFVPALIAIAITGKVTEKDNLIIRALKAAYRPVLAAAVRVPFAFVGAALLLLVGAGILFTRLGTEFIPQLDEKSIALNATRIPSTSLTQSQAMQLKVEEVVSKFPQVAYVFSKTGTAEVATDPMPGRTPIRVPKTMPMSFFMVFPSIPRLPQQLPAGRRILSPWCTSVVAPVTESTAVTFTSQVESWGETFESAL